LLLVPRRQGLHGRGPERRFRTRLGTARRARPRQRSEGPGVARTLHRPPGLRALRREDGL